MASDRSGCGDVPRAAGCDASIVGVEPWGRMQVDEPRRTRVADDESREMIQLARGGRRRARQVMVSKGRGPMSPELLELLVTREMPFGKYKGRIIADLPGHYLAWFARRGFPPGQLGQLLALMYELDHNDLVGLLEPLRRRG